MERTVDDTFYTGTELSLDVGSSGSGLFYLFIN